MTFTLTGIDEPHCAEKVTVKGPRRLLFDLMAKLDPVETVCDAGVTVKLEGYEATTPLVMLMLMMMLAVPPPFFLTETLVDEAWIVHCGGPASPPTPSPEMSKQGVLSTVSVLLTTVEARTEADGVIVLLYGTLGRFGCWFSTVTSPEPDTSTFNPSSGLLVVMIANVVTQEAPGVTVRPRQLKSTVGRPELLATSAPVSRLKLRVVGTPLLENPS